MRIVNIATQQEEQEFATKAAHHFAFDRRHFTYAEDDPKPGKHFAVRWNPFTVLVLKLDENHTPACYPTNELIRADLPPLKGEPIIGVVEVSTHEIEELHDRIAQLEQRNRNQAVALRDIGQALGLTKKQASKIENVIAAAKRAAK
jgi:hypothetical protein